jgi:hypothetical protein
MYVDAAQKGLKPSTKSPDIQDKGNADLFAQTTFNHLRAQAPQRFKSFRLPAINQPFFSRNKIRRFRDVGYIGVLIIKSAFPPIQ